MQQYGLNKTQSGDGKVSSLTKSLISQDQEKATRDQELRMFVPVGSNIQRPQLSAPSLGFRRFYVQICILILVFIMMVVVRTISNMRLAFNEYHSDSDTDGELVVLPEEFAKSRLAYCLDGSPGGYYIRNVLSFRIELGFSVLEQTWFIDASKVVFVPVGLNIQRPQLSAPSLGFRRFYVQICILILVFIMMVVVRTISNMRLAFNEYHSDSDTDGELVVLPEEFAKSRLAYCLAGSPGGYYIRNGKSSDINKWIIHLQSGAWCETLDDCYDRSFTALGSSIRAPLSSTFNGILSASEGVNPDFHTWNMVQFLYCDGSSFLGNKSEVIDHKHRTLHFGGARVFSALVEYLLMKTELSSADQVILTGSSAGGLAALINVDFLRRKLSSVKTLHAILDAMLFMDSQDINGFHSMQELLRKMYYLHSVKDAMSIKECTAGLSPDIGWKCLDPLYFYRYLFTPAFFINSLHDSWYIRNALGIACDFKNCGEREIITILKFKKLTLNAIQPLKLSVHDGMFLTSCPLHEMLVKPWFSDVVRVNNTSVQQAISQWYSHQFSSPVKYMEDRTFHESVSRCPAL